MVPSTISRSVFYILAFLALISYKTKSQDTVSSITFASRSLDNIKTEISYWDIHYNNFFKQKFKLKDTSYQTIVNPKSLGFGRVMVHGYKNQRLVYFIEPGDSVYIKAEISNGKINYIAGGNELNRHLSIWNELVSPYYENRMKESFNNKRLEYVKKFPNSKFSAFLLIGDFGGYQRFPIDTLSKYADKLSGNVLESYYGRRIIDRITNASKRTVSINLLGTPADSLLSLNNHLGKYVILDFWATWCKPCIKELPDFKRAYKTYHNKAYFMSISGDTDIRKWERFIKRKNMLWDQKIFDKNIISEVFGVDVYPTKFVIDPNGNIIQIFIGEGMEFYNFLRQLNAEY